MEKRTRKKHSISRKECPKCKGLVGLNAFQKHVDACSGIDRRHRKNYKMIENIDFVIIDGAYKCNHKNCLSTFLNKKGVTMHIWRKHTKEGKNFNPNDGYKNGRSAWNKGKSNYSRESLYKLRKEIFTGEGKCKDCGMMIKKPSGRSLLEIHHIDGNKHNNESSNLELLCPNCHVLKTTPKTKEQRSIAKEFRKQLAKKVEHSFKEKLIDFSKKGWQIRLSEILEINSKDIKYTVKHLLPKFFWTECYEGKIEEIF